MPSPNVSPLRFPEADARAVAFLQSLEQEDRSGELLAHAERRRATSEAFVAEGESEPRWLAARARDLLSLLERDFSFLPRYLSLTRPALGLVWPVVLLAFILGLATNALGPARRVHVLALPLLGLIVWNLAMILTLIGSRLLPTLRKLERPWLARFLEGWVGRLALKLPRRLASGNPERWRQVLTADLAFWLPATGPLVGARVRRLLHLGALALVAGAVAGMYLRGVGFAYRASWESTFLDAGVVDGLLGAVLGPAAWLLGTEVPSVAAIESPASGDAAPWIHLWAVTAALFVGVPRLALAGLEALRCARLARWLPLPLADGYRRRLRAMAETKVERWTIWPYSFTLTPGAAAALKTALLDLAGARADVRLAPVLDYGAETPAGEEALGGRVVVFNLAQTPEDEVHGALLAALRRDLVAGDVLLVLIDSSAYRRQLGTGEVAERRLEERRRVWDAAIAAQGLRAVHLELQAALPEGALAELAVAAWPSGVLGGRG